MLSTYLIVHSLLALYLLTTGVAGAFHTKLPSKVHNLSFIYFGWSLIGQIFSLQLLSLAFVSLCFAAFGPEPKFIIGLANVFSMVCFIMIMRQAWLSSQVLSRVEPNGQAASVWRFFAGALFPIQLGSRGVRRIKNIAYGPEGRKHLLDIYLPKGPATAPMPVLLHVHGGGWIVGSKHQQAQPLIQYMASQGWLVIDINYRLAPWNRMPVMIQDVIRAVAWTKANITSYNGDPDFVALTGGSAGGHLVALAALASDVDGLRPELGDADCTVDACIPVYGLYDLLDQNQAMEVGASEIRSFMTRFVMPKSYCEDAALWEKISPINHISPSAPPMLILHGQHDSLADLESAKAFAESLSRISKNKVTFVDLPGQQHAYDCAYSPPAPEHARAVHRFLESVRKDKQR